jgi:soluble lytic murein transglycosylase-like protein
MALTVEQFIDSLFYQESRRGAVNTDLPNYAGAQGPMQVIPKTFAGLKAQGIIPQDWSLSNKEQAREAGNRHARMLWNQYGGDPAKAAAAYYSGPKAVTAQGIKNFSDPLNSSASLGATSILKVLVLSQFQF